MKTVTFSIKPLSEVADEFAKTYGPFPQEAIPEVMKVASELLDSEHVAA
jgi:hypothetical protein